MLLAAASPSCCVDSRKHRLQKPCLFLRRRTCWFSFGASRLRVNKDVVAAARDALLRSVIAPRSLSHSSLNVCQTFLFFPPPPLVCSLSTEFREQCWSACPSRMPSAFTASTHCAGGECCCYRDSDMSDCWIFKQTIFNISLAVIKNKLRMSPVGKWEKTRKGKKKMEQHTPTCRQSQHFKLHLHLVAR